MKNNSAIDNFIRRVIKEQDEQPQVEKPKPASDPTSKPKPKKKKRKKHGPGEIVVGYGAGKKSGGRFLGSVNDAGALATENPKQLMNNLRVKSGGSDLTGVMSIVQQAISGNQTMQEAFGGVTMIQAKGKKAVRINPGKINARNGTNLMHHVIVGAQGAKLFNASNAVQIQLADNSIIIHLSPYKNSWGVKE